MSRKSIYLVKRSDRLIKGKPTYYARFRDEAGELLPWRSTGETSKTRAENWALKEYKAGRISTRENLTFGTYSEKWWKWGECDFIRGRLARGKSISRTYADVQRGYLDSHILPYFRSKKLSQITPRMIEDWLLKLKDSPRNLEKPDSEPLSATTVNHCLTTLKTVHGEAHRLGVIASNPAGPVEQLREASKEKQILTAEEVRKLFAEETMEEVWAGSLPHFTLNMLAASTGLRMGEVQGLQVQHVHSDYIAIVNAWERKYGLKEPKWGSAREVPIPTRTSRYLVQVVEESPYREPESLVFHGTDGQTPIGHKEILDALYAALSAIGISGKARKQRNVTFHSWRHLFNSLCRSRIPDYKLQRLTGHRTQEMTEHYTHLNISDFADVVALQEEVLG